MSGRIFLAVIVKVITVSLKMGFVESASLNLD